MLVLVAAKSFLGRHNVRAAAVVTGVERVALGNDLDKRHAVDRSAKRGDQRRLVRGNRPQPQSTYTR